LFPYIIQRLNELKDLIRPIDEKAVNQRPCSNRITLETEHLVDQIFQHLNVKRVGKEYDRENTLSF